MADDDASASTKRPASGMRGRATRRGGAAANASAASADLDTNATEDAEGEGEGASWKVELESIMSGTHPALVEALEPHDQKIVHRSGRPRASAADRQH